MPAICNSQENRSFPPSVANVRGVLETAAEPVRERDEEEECARLMQDVWKRLERVLVRNYSAFDAIGRALGDPDNGDIEPLERAAEGYEWEERRSHDQLIERLSEMLGMASEGDRAVELEAAWRCANELEHLSECGRRAWRLAVRKNAGGFSFPVEAYREVGEMAKRMEEVFYWTFEALRLRYYDMSEPQFRDARRIMWREAGIARRILENSILTCRRSHEMRRTKDRCSIPGGVAFLDFIIIMSRACSCLAAIGESAGCLGRFHVARVGGEPAPYSSEP